MATTKTTPTRRRPASGEAFGMPSAATLRKLKISPEVAWYLVCRGIPFPDCPPMIKTPEPRKVRGAVFSFERVDQVMAGFKVLRHTQGEMAGKPLIPDPWQVAYILAPVFGWVKLNSRGNWARIIRKLYVDVPRKNGKTTLAGGIGIYLTAGDGEAGAQVVAAATTRDQAHFAFDPVKFLAERAPGLRGKVKALSSSITHPRTGSVFHVVSSSADAQHGANIHGAIIDELHLHKKPDLVEAIETGTGARHQPLVMAITTADDGTPNSIYNRKRHYIEQLAKGLFVDPATYGVVWGVPRNANPFDPATHKAANPGYGISPTAEFLDMQAAEAKNSPANLASFKRLHLGIRTKQTTEYIGLENWQRNRGQLWTPAALEGRVCFGGLDLAAVSDITALAWIFPKEGPGYDLLFHFWTPEENVEILDKRVAGAASEWVEAGWLTVTPGDVTDYDYIRQQVVEDRDRYSVMSVGIDRWNATQLTTDLLAADVPMVKVPQGFRTMSPAMKEMQRLVLRGKRGNPMMEHGGNPVMEWMIDNLAVAIDASGNVKPDKANAADKIDGVSALATALSEALNSNQVYSDYSGGDGSLLVAT